MPWGRIVKALSGYYYVLPEDQPYEESRIIQCRARGVFRIKGKAPLVGDWVRFELAGGNEGVVAEVQERTTELIRPPIANADLAVLVFSLEEPEFSPLLLDRFLVHTERAGLSAVICLTKADLLEDRTEIGHIRQVYEPLGYRVLVTSAKRGEGIEELKELLSGHISVFAGQSGVGKSSLLNAIFPNLNLKTSEISHRLGRGKHTTRHVELLSLGPGTWVADTPGFSQLEFADMEPEDLSRYFVEFHSLSGHCRFRGCLHQKEPGCAVRAAVERGEAAQSRYEHYLEFLEEVKEARLRRY